MTSSWLARRLVAVGLALATLVGAPIALSAELETTVSADVVGVGERFEVQLSLPLEGDEDPSDPRLPIEGPAEVHGPSMGTTRSVTMHNFSVSTQTKVVVTWTVVATGKGRISIGPGSLKLGNKRLKGDATSVTVTEEPQRRRRRSRDPFDDFFSHDPFEMMRRGRLAPELPTAPAELVPESAPDSIGFLVARLSKSSVVVGESVVLNVYAYGSRGSFQEANPVEPSLADFLTFREVQSSFEEPKYRAEIGGRSFEVAKLRQIVLVPLKAGELEIGAMHAILHGQGYPEKGSALGYSVESAPVRLHVSEAPKQGRPPEFVEGDVGSFEMETELRPTELMEGEYAELLVHIRGRGNLPTRIPLPEGAGWEWQSPSTVGEPEVDNGELRGRRTIKIPLRVLSPGELRLGTLSLPYYDPVRHEYLRLEAALPPISVRPRPAPPKGAAPSAADPVDPKAALAPTVPDLNALVTARKSLGRGDGGVPLESKIWPVALLAPPLSLGLYGAILAIVKLVRRKPKARDLQAQNRKAADRAVAELARAEKSRTGRVDGTVVRGTLEAVLVASIGKSGRGMTSEELAETLSKSGVAAEVIRGLVELQKALDHLEFAGQGESSAIPEVAPLLEKVLRTSSARRPT